MRGASIVTRPEASTHQRGSHRTDLLRPDPSADRAGNLVAAVDYLRRFDAELARSKDQHRFLLEHPVTNELLRFAITGDAFAQRRRLGTAGR